MHTPRVVLSTSGACAVFALSVLAHTPAPPFSGADDLHVMTSGAFTAAFKALAADWERSTGHKVITHLRQLDGRGADDDSESPGAW